MTATTRPARATVRATLVAALAAALAGTTLALPASAAAADSLPAADLVAVTNSYYYNGTVDQVVTDDGAAAWALGKARDRLGKQLTDVSYRVNRIDLTTIPVDYGTPVLDLPTADVPLGTRVNVEAAGAGFLLAIDRGTTFEVRRYTADGTPAASTLTTIPVGAGDRNALHTDSAGPAVALAVASPATGSIAVRYSTDAGATWAAGTHPAPGYDPQTRRLVSYDGQFLTLSWRDTSGVVHLDVADTRADGPLTFVGHVLPGGRDGTTPATVRTNGQGGRTLNWVTRDLSSPNQVLHEDPLDATWTETDPAADPAADADTWVVPGNGSQAGMDLPAVSDTHLATRNSDTESNMFARTGVAPGSSLTALTASNGAADNGAPTATDWAGPIALSSPEFAETTSVHGNDNVYYRPDQFARPYTSTSDGNGAANGAPVGSLLAAELWAVDPEGATCTLTSPSGTTTPADDWRLDFPLAPTRHVSSYSGNWTACAVAKDDLGPGQHTLAVTGAATVLSRNDPDGLPAQGTASVTFTVPDPDVPTGPDCDTHPEDPACDEEPTGPDCDTNPDDPACDEDPTGPDCELDPGDPQCPAAPGEPPLATFLDGKALRILTRPSVRFEALTSKNDVRHQWQTAPLSRRGTLGEATTGELRDTTTYRPRIRPGTGLCVRARAHRPSTGQTSEWTPWRCVIAPTDDRKLRGYGIARGWAPAAYLRTTTTLKRAGAKLSGPGVQGANRITATFRKTGHRGAVAVSVGQRRVRVVRVPAGRGTVTKTLRLGPRFGPVKFTRLSRKGKVKVDAFTLWHTR